MDPATSCTLIKDPPPTSVTYTLSSSSQSTPKSACRKTLRCGYNKTIVKVDECGINLEEKVCEWNIEEKTSDTCFVFMGNGKRDHGMPDRNGKNFCLPGDTIMMLPTKGINANREAIVIMNICYCNRCCPTPLGTSKPKKRAYDAASSDSDADSSYDNDTVIVSASDDESEAEPISSNTSSASAATLPFPSGYRVSIQPLNLQSSTVTLEFANKRQTIKLTTEFLPGFGFRKELLDDDSEDGLGSHKACRHQIFFYGFIKLKDLSYLCQAEEAGKMADTPEENKSALSHITGITIVAIKAGKKKNSSMNPVLKRMLNESTLADFQIIAPSGKAIPCHQAVLSVRSPVFERMLVQQHVGKMRDRGKLHLPNYVMGDSGIEITDETAEAFLNFVYFGGKILMRRNFEVACGVMKLAHLYNIPDLVAAAAWIILDKLDPQTSTFSDVKLLWELFSFVRLLEKVQLMCVLKNKIMKALRRCVLQQSSKRARTANNVDGINALDFMLVGEKEALKEWIMDSVKMGEANNDDDDSSDG